MRYFIVAFLLGYAITARGAAAGEAIDLNHASQTELESLPGIGAKRANAIIAFREHHPFRRAQELLRIKGIGARMFTRLKPLVIAGDSAPGHAASSRAELPASPSQATAAAR